MVVLDITIQILVFLELFDHELITFVDVSRLVSFVELIKGCNKDRIALRASLAVMFDQTNLEAIQKSAISES